MFRTTSLVVIATICSVAFAEDGLGFGMPLIGTDAMKNLHLNSSQRVLVNGNDLMSTVELIRDMTNEVRSLRNRLARHTRSKSPTNSPSTLSPTNSPTNSVPTNSPTNSVPTNSPTTSEPTASTTLSPTNSPTTSAPTVSAPTCVYAGTTTWSQDCSVTSTDDLQDAAMKTACEGAYGNGAYSASYNQLVEGKIQGLPTSNPTTQYIVFSLPEPDVCNGHRTDHSTCEPRNCVRGGVAFPTTCGLDIGWTYNCHTATRSTVCCSPTP